VETAIGVFASRDCAEDAVKDLLRLGVPEEAIVFLTLAESEAKTTGKEFGATVGGFVGGAAGLSAGVAAATFMFVPGIGQVFALGFGAAALLGLMGAGTGAVVGKAVSDTVPAQPTPDEKCSDDVTFFREVLKQGRSLVVVRTDSAAIAKKASYTLDRLGLGLRPLSPAKMKAVTRQIGSVAVVDICGKITHGEGNVMLRKVVYDLLDKDNKRILLNLGEVHYIDSSGMGELVRVYTSIRNQGGEMKLVNLSGRVRDLLQMTRLNAVFQIEDSEAAAIDSFGGDSQQVA
jgi:anti-sigma B factor antagonist